MSSHAEIPKNKETSIAPWLSVRNAAEAIHFYKNAFGVKKLYSLQMDDGRPIIAQLSIDGADFWIQEDPETSPDSDGQGSVRMIVTVNDPDSMFIQAIEAGAIEVVPINEDHGWRIGRLVDPLGHHWEIGKRVNS
ncbi:VOC family protein [Sutcliffiella sp. NPDC057660]|uniref:VOC family protein n=1 Tax=Sutcliffiella sp. NPDC057660 TaxID=3346199 RepID=UPI0036BF384A